MIPINQLKRLVRSTGVKRIYSNVYPLLQTEIRKFLLYIVKRGELYLDYLDKSILSFRIISLTIPFHLNTEQAIFKRLKIRPVKKKREYRYRTCIQSSRDSRYYKSKSSELFFYHEPFIRALKDMTNIWISKRGKLLIHYAAERYLHRLILQAKNNMGVKSTLDGGHFRISSRFSEEILSISQGIGIHGGIRKTLRLVSLHKQISTRGCNYFDSYLTSIIFFIITKAKDLLLTKGCNKPGYLTARELYFSCLLFLPEDMSVRIEYMDSSDNFFSPKLKKLLKLYNHHITKSSVAQLSNIVFSISKYYLEKVCQKLLEENRQRILPVDFEGILAVF